MPAEILLVEDRESLRAMLAETLTREGYSVEAVATGEEALRRLAEGRRYTLVLTDFKMPGADGLDVLRAATASDATIAVVVLTGFGTVETAVTAMKMGAADFLSKPVDPDLLLLLVKRHVRARRSRIPSSPPRRASRECPTSSGLRRRSPRLWSGSGWPPPRRSRSC